MEYLPANILNIDFDLPKIVEFVAKRPYLFNSGEFISANRLLSYCTFLIKDIYEYINAKLTDGTQAIIVRKAPLMKKRYEDELNKI